MPSLGEVKAGDRLPERSHTPSNVSLFLYNAAIWNPHRIHYDERYTVRLGSIQKCPPGRMQHSGG
jgi:3-methylfumaryl-CoA hydratase